MKLRWQAVPAQHDLDTALKFVESKLKKPANQTWDEAIRGPKMSNPTGWTVFKYQMPVKEEFDLSLPADARIIRVDDQDGFFWLWALVNTGETKMETRKFISVKTGGTTKIVNPDDYKYIGFCKLYVQQELGLYIFEKL